MNVTLARTFLEVIETGKFNRAAERLNVTQSTVTTRIDTLEELVGQKLIVRSKSGAALTSAGFKFVRHAEMFVQVWSQARNEVALPKGFEDVCNLGCHYDLWQGAGQLWLNRLRESNPQIALSVWTGDRQELNRWLASGMIDIAFLFDTDVRADWHLSLLFEDRLLQVATVAREVQRWDPAYVYVDHGSEFRRQHAAAYPVDETASVTFSNSTWAMEHLLKWGGSAYLPYRLAAAAIVAGELFPVKHAPEFKRPCHVAVSRHAADNWTWLDASLAGLRGEAAMNENVDW